MVSDGTFVQLLLRAKELGAMLNLHAENPDLIDLNVAKFKAEGKLSPWYHYMSRPEAVEAEADKRAVHWAKHFEGPLYIVHMADKEGLEAAVEAKMQDMIFILKHARSISSLQTKYIKEKTAETSSALLR